MRPENMAPSTFGVLEHSRKRMWTWEIVSGTNASDITNLVVHLFLKRDACCCNGYKAFLQVNGEIRDVVVCKSPTWCQPIYGKKKSELFSWTEEGHDLEIWYNNLRVYTEMAHLFVDGVEWKTKLPFDKFWRSFAVRSFLWALVMLLFAGGCLGVGILFLFGGSIWKPILFFFLSIVSLILVFIQFFVGVFLLVRRPERSNAENNTLTAGGVLSERKVLVEEDELQIL